MPKGLGNEKTKVHEDYSKLTKIDELITGTLNSLLYARGDAERSDYKTNRNINNQINIVTIRIILILN